ncbi:minor histocompatibility protein HA-1-like [Sinocyclocheilus grahami]|uniref:minor histocompatibility protein HA-1-like n=1 Tax=Sinocyclocheilus grahami TaxID=75366 RepID=UPI0007AD239E|nr:PREDICTED: minor histocompatibility protein HA-1-like [Sinocyclocheilus grahami]
MLKRGGSSSKSYSPYATSQRVKKSSSKTKLDILPNRPNVWLKQLSALQEQPRKDAVDSATSSSHTSSNLSPPVLDVPSSCPGTPLAQHTKLVGCPSPMGTLKRPTSLSRNPSAAGFPIQSWVFSKGAGKSVIAQSPSPETPETTVAIEVEDIPSLLRIVERFAKAVEKLKDVVLEDKQENRRPLAHEFLGEVLRILRQVISMYPLLNTVETLTAAGKLISQVKGYHYEVCNEADKKDFEKAIETIAVAFSSNVSELLMGEVDSSTLLSVLPSEKSRSMENLSGHDSLHTRSDSSELVMSAEEVDIILQRSEGGVDSALTYAKTISKYMKDLISYVEKKFALELEFSKGLQRIYQTCKQTITQPHMPFFSIYSLALEQDLEQSAGMQQAASTLQNQTFIMISKVVMQMVLNCFFVLLSARGHMTHKSWGSTVSDTDSVGGGSGLGSPTTSTGDISKMARTSSTGTMSSNEDAEEKDSNVTSFETPNINGIESEIVVPTGPFRNVGLSKAAQTHKLRKLRSPSKCRECDSYVYFQGAECEECFLACHKRCLETLAIQCGHKKLQGRLQLFGQDFSQVSGNSPDSIPFIIKKCIGEIERRALRMKGIYRVNGVKTRVEKLCQAFENGKELVELSQCSPHDISNVLKLYLRQLPEPIMPFRLYNSLMGLAKESLAVVGPEGAETGKGPDLVDLGPETDPELLALVDRLKNLLKELPKQNTATLRYIARHLRRIAELEDDNKMSPSNLGIVFGPSLMRPRPSGATVSLSSLVDYPYQARIVETLIVFYPSIFHSDSSRPASTSTPRTQSLQQESSIDEEHCSNDEQGVTDEPDAAESDKLEGHAESSPGTPGSPEHSLDSDSDADEERGRGELQPPSPTDQALGSTTETQMRLPILLVNLQCPSSSNNSSNPPALPASEPPELDEPEAAPTSSLAALNINQSNGTSTTLTL